MEQVQTLFREGVMSHLDLLGSLSQNLTAKQEDKRRQEEAVQEKREVILQLRKERDELRAKVKQQKEEIQALSMTDDGSRHPGPSTQDALQDLRLEGMRGAMEALWFTGISGKKTDSGFCFCLSTAFEGHYLDSYYIQVENLQKPRISRHNIPVFIPLREITSSHLQTDLKKFLSVLSDHLNAYAGRKYQADQLQVSAGPYIPDTLQRNSLHTVLSFSYNVTLHDQTFCFSAKLQYGAVTCVLPTEAQVTCPDSAEWVQAAGTFHSGTFRSKPLHRALESLVA